MLSLNMVAPAVTSVLLLIGGTMTLIPPWQSIENGVAPSTIEGDELNRKVEIQIPELTHAQNVWIYALEWCESRGVPSAINEVDRDGTSSYYSFQFKPGTFRHYGELFGVIEKGLTSEEIFKLMKSRDLQFEIVKQMVLHYSEINWSQQFPDCVNKYIGKPPRY